VFSGKDVSRRNTSDGLIGHLIKNIVDTP
jgi:hypothetical protein